MTSTNTQLFEHAVPANNLVQPDSDQPNSVEASIRSFIFEQYPLCRQKDLKHTDSLIESGIVDSMGILELVAFVESDFDIQVEDTDLTPENFESIEAIATFVAHKRGLDPNSQPAL